MSSTASGAEPDYDGRAGAERLKRDGHRVTFARDVGVEALDVKADGGLVEAELADHPAPGDALMARVLMVTSSIGPDMATALGEKSASTACATGLSQRRCAKQSRSRRR